MYWLGLHHVVPMSDSTRDKIGMWSCRFWMAYVLLYFLQLREERLDFQKETRLLLSKFKKSEMSPEQQKQNVAKLEQMQSVKQDWTVNLVINAAYLPLTLVSFMFLDNEKRIFE